MNALQELIDRARLASERMSAKNPHRQLLREMAVALVAQARMLADLAPPPSAERRTDGGIILP